MRVTTEYTPYTDRPKQDRPNHLDGRRLRVVVVGGGIAGLATAYYLQKGAQASGVALECTLVESDARLGGKIVTHSQGGFVVEGGPDSFLTQKPWALQLCRELGLGDRLIGVNETQRKTTILWQGRFRPLPDGVFLIVPTRFMPFALSSLFSPLGKLRMALDLVIPRRKETRDESVGSFIRRRLGQEALDRLGDPLMGGVHTSDPEQQSLRASFPRFAEIERNYGSLIRGMLAARRAAPPATTKPLPPFMSLRGGVQELVTALAQRLDGVDVRLGRRVTRLNQTTSGYRVALDDGAEMEVDAVVLAVPARIAAPLAQDIDADLAARLASIRYISTSTVSLGYRRADIGHSLDGSGFLIPTKEGHRITGCTWSSTKFADRAPEDSVLLRCFIGRPTDQVTPLLPEAELVRIAREELRALMGITAEPVMAQVFTWRDGHPQYDVGHLDRMAEIDRLCAAHLGLYLTGSSYRGVGLPDCIHNASLVAEALLQQMPAEVGATKHEIGATT